MAAADKKYIVSPLLDFILLGGGSLVLFPLIMYAFPVAQIRTHNLLPAFFAISLFFNYVANFPHFLYSYQLLYQDFFKKATGALDKPLQALFIWASVVVPAAMVILFTYCYAYHDFILLGFAANIGVLISGWHYAKQAFGVLIVTSIYQKVFYTPWERKILVWNANILWCYVWIMLNTGMHSREFWHAKFYTLGFPSGVQRLFLYLVCLGALSCIFIFIRKYIKESVLPPLSGIVAYVTTLYFWLVLLRYYPSNTRIHPIVLLIPSMHAIQYITIVFRMKHNENKLQKLTSMSLAFFIVGGFTLGVLGFVYVPRMLDRNFNTQGALYESVLFVTIFAVFINIHHFFIDNVIWRKENSEVKNYLYEFH